MTMTVAVLNFFTAAVQVVAYFSTENPLYIATGATFFCCGLFWLHNR